MKNKSLKKIVIISLSVIVACLIIFFGNKYYKILKEPVASAINAIPKNSALIIELKKSSGLYEDVSEKNLLWKELCNIESFNKLNKQIFYLDSSISVNSKLSGIIENNSVYVSVHFSGYDKFDCLYLVALQNTRQKSLIEDFVGEKKVVSKIKHKGKTVYKLKLSAFEKPFYYSVCKGIFIGSFSDLLVKNSISTLLSGNNLENDKELAKISSANVDGIVYVNFKYFYRLIAKFSSPAHRNNISSLLDFAFWSKLDLNIKDDAIILNGYTSTSDSGDFQLNLFKEQKAQKIDIINILPENTSFFLYNGFEDFEKYFSEYKEFLIRKNKVYDKENLIERANKKYKINLEKSMLSWVKNEMAVVVSNSSSESNSENTYAVFKAIDVKEALQSLDKLSATINEQKDNVPDTIIHRNFIINKIDISSIFPMFFGPMYQNLESNYYTAISDYIVFANSETALRDFINSYLIERTLGKSEEYDKFSNNISGKANIYLYCNIRKSIDFLQNYLNDEYGEMLSNYAQNFRNFDAIGIQFISEKKLFYTNLNLWYNSAFKEDSISSWETAVDAPIFKGPYFVLDHRTNSKKILVFDVANNMYMLDNHGKISWKTQIAEKPLSKVHLIDCFNNGKLQYLFNTENFIYLIDLNGNIVENYPIKLETKATNGIAVIDYEKNKDYRLIVACANKKIYNYKTDGTITKGWESPEISTIITKPIQYLSFKGKDFVIISDTLGNVIFCNRRGEPRIEAELAFTNALNTEFFMEKFDGENKMFTTDKTGRIVVVSNVGEVEKSFINEFSPNHYFLYKDFDNDDSKDFIYLDNNKLFVYNDKKVLIFKYEFEDEISFEPVYISNSSDGPLIGCVSKQAKKIFLLNKDGIIEKSAELSGDTQFIVNISKSNNQINLVVGSGKIICNYLIQ